jgi:hypothetical protein
MSQQRPASDSSTWDPKPPKDPVVVGDLIDSVLGRISKGAPGSVLSLRSAWRDVVGAKLADRCSPVDLERGVLMVEAVDGGTISLLRFESENIVRKASDLCTEPVSTVRFRVKRNRT